jgi:hypothetical protein
MSEQRWLDFGRLVDEMFGEPTVGRDDLAVWGGSFAAGDLDRFISAWALPREGMPWSLWQWTDRIEVQYGQGAPGELEYLERGRVFGPQGDFEIRREGERFLWRFVGQRDTAMPPAFQAADYWQGREGTRLRPCRRTALLWGSRQAAAPHGKQGWHDDRVSQARLEYPRLEGDRVQAAYVEYLDGGNVEFVRYVDLANRPD